MYIVISSQNNVENPHGQTASTEYSSLLLQSTAPEIQTNRCTCNSSRVK